MRRAASVEARGLAAALEIARHVERVGGVAAAGDAKRERAHVPLIHGAEPAIGRRVEPRLLVGARALRPVVVT